MNPGSGDFKFKRLSAYLQGFIFKNSNPSSERTRDVDGKTITVSLYSGWKDDKEFHYYLFWIEFDGTEEFIWGLFTAPPKLAEKSLAQERGYVRRRPPIEILNDKQFI